MNKLLPLAVFAATWSLSFLPCHADPIGPKPGELVTVRGFQLSITADSAEYAVSTPIGIDTSIKNVTDKSLPIAKSSFAADYQIQVTTKENVNVPLTRCGQLLEKNKRSFLVEGLSTFRQGNPTLNRSYLINCMT